MLETFFAFSEEMQRGKMPLPTRKGRFAPVSLDDTCHGVVRTILKHMRSEQRGNTHTLELTGNRTVDGHKIAEEASEKLDTQIRVEDISLERTKEILRRNMKKSHEAVIEMIVEVFELIREDKFDKQTDDLQKILGSEPTSVADFFEKNQREFKP